MNAVLAPGIAHVSFSGGGTFLPARNPYDREILAEHVADRVRTNGVVQVLVKDQRWTVRLGVNPPVPDCTACGCSLSVACCSSGRDGLPYCVKCALEDRKMPSRAATRLIASKVQCTLHAS